MTAPFINAEHKSSGARLAVPVEQLIAAQPSLQCDVLIVGSGYGGAFAALELARPGRRVWLFERGREYALGEFPESIGELPGHVRFSRNGGEPGGRADALFDLRLNKELSVLVGNGLGGTSLINANVAVAPTPEQLRENVWPQALRDRPEQLEPYFDEVRRLLDVQPHPEANTFAKYRALRRLADKLDEADCTPAPLAVSHRDGDNGVGVTQRRCINCGNCVTGCNTGAKNTLAMNALPLARSRGAELFTGATTLSVRRYQGPAGTASPRWTVTCARTATLGGERVDTFEVHAHTVILAAGSLGSTEILLRSASENGLACAEGLGSRFSGNGDFLAAGYAQSEPVEAVADADLAGNSAGPGSVGPTIIGMVRASGRGRLPAGTTLEDGAAPSALASAMGSLLATTALPHRYVKWRQPGWFRDNPQADTLAVQPQALRHSQILLGMGRDNAGGRLRLDNGRLRVEWPNISAQPAYDGLDQALRRAERDGGFDGGDYLPNPAWQPVPDSFAAVVGGVERGTLVTVHPLGGCAMADDRNGGVVDHTGAVFDAAADETRAVHAGLHVLDGAILPAAVGVNPLLTIAALSLRAARGIAAELPGRADALPAVKVAAPWREPRRVLERVVVPPQRVRAQLTEYLIGKRGLALSPAWSQRMFPGDLASALRRDHGLVAKVKVELDLWDWLRDPAQPLPAEIELYAWELDHFDSVPVEQLGEPFASGRGAVRLLAADRPGLLGTVWRIALALVQFLRLRGWRDLGSLSSQGSWWQTLRKLPATVAGFLRAARNHTVYRLLDYRFELRMLRGSAPPFTLAGAKRLAYAPGQKNLWDALCELDYRLSAKGCGEVAGTLAVDTVGMIRERRLQIAAAPDTPAVVTALAGLGAMALRALVSTHFWSFRGLDYNQLTLNDPAPVVPLRLSDGSQSVAQRHPLRVARHSGGDDTIELWLTRYARTAEIAADARPLLLIHGLSHGGGAFTTDTIDCSMAAHFVGQGYDVWVFDHRLSNRLGELPTQSSSMDDIAENDIPAAVRHIYAAYGERPLDVFAHCIGAGCAAMAVLGGHLHDHRRDRPLLRSLAIHAVHPWVVPSLHNHMSGALGALYKDALGQLVVEPLPPAGADAKAGIADQLLDRIGSSLPWPARDRLDHERHRLPPAAGTAICNRMALIFGRQWCHRNLDERTHARLAELLGPSHIDVFRHIFFLLLRQRLTDRHGNNVYLTADNLQRYWRFDTLFAHGAENQVFHPRSARRSQKILDQVLNRLSGRVGAPYRVELLVLPNVGHMDFLLGKNAARAYSPEVSGSGVYPGLQNFFEAQPQPALDSPTVLRLTDPPRNARPPRPPAVGPIFNYAVGADGVRLQFWAEQAAIGTSNRFAARAALIAADGEPSAVCLPTDLSRAYAERELPLPGQYWSGDIPLAATARPDRLELELGYEDPLWHQVAPATTPRPGLPAGQIELASIPLAGMPWFERLLADPDGRRNQRWSILAGSCRWPGTPFEREAVDRVFGAMLSQARAEFGGVDGLWLVGDQIYADAVANLFATTEPNERYAKRYRDALSGHRIGEEMFSGRNLAELMRRLPTWMVPDDHEFNDNWSGREWPRQDEHRAGGDSGNVRLLSDGYSAAVAYLWRRGDDAGRWPALTEGGGLWHSFSLRGLPAFAMDTRSERELRSRANWRGARMVSNAQLDALCAWLRGLATDDRPKFILCGGVFGLVETEAALTAEACLASDGWLGYPATWQAVLRCIAENAVRNVFFLCGDPHLSALAALTIDSGRHRARAWSIVASGLSATMPFANAKPHDYVFGQAVDLPESTPQLSASSRATLLSTATRQFSRIDVKAVESGGWSVRVRVFDDTGELRAENTVFTEPALSPAPLVSEP